MLEFNKLERKIAERLGNFAVTPCVGVWIEIVLRVKAAATGFVTPCVGVWIEIRRARRPAPHCSSLPVWECGLKCLQGTRQRLIRGHSLCGSVD